MKILFTNYNTETSTEATSLSFALRNAGVESQVWDDPRMSAFDVFDSYKPDLFVTSYTNLTEDIIKRLSGDKCKVVLNVCCIGENEAKSLEETLLKANINCVFAIYRFDKPKGFSKIKLVQIMPAADVFLPASQPGNRQIPFGVLYSDPNDMQSPPEEVGDVYHKIVMNRELSQADVAMNVVDLVNSCGVYTNMLMMGNDQAFLCGQPFFDLSVRITGKTAINITPENQPCVASFMENLFPDLPETPEAAKEYIKSTILYRHTYINRAERLMKNLGEEGVCENLRKLRDSIRNNLQNPRS